MERGINLVRTILDSAEQASTFVQAANGALSRAQQSEEFAAYVDQNLGNLGASHSGSLPLYQQFRGSGGAAVSEQLEALSQAFGIQWQRRSWTEEELRGIARLQEEFQILEGAEAN